MIARDRQGGFSGPLVAVILMIVIVGVLGTQALSRLLTAGRGEERVRMQLEAAGRALTQYVATARRLPCPANPAADAGEEVVLAGNPARCNHVEGTLPWKTIGLARGDSIDPWGHKISYRAYTGAAGSLTQPEGASMVHCDTSDPSPAATTTLDSGTSAGALCQPQSRITLRSTPPGTYATSGFLHSKGFTVNDMGTARNGVAYVLVSHGPTGRGAYTTSGTRREMPVGDELANTGSTGPYVIKAFSPPGTDPASAAHFDDYVAYRPIDELVKSAGLEARDWPEAIAITFDRPTVEAAVGGSVTPGQSVGQVTVTFVGAVASGLTTGGTAVELSYGENAGYGGIGVAGGGSAFVQSTANERLRLTIPEKGEKFGITLNHFGYYNGDVLEIVEFRFFLDGVQVDVPKYGIGCNVDGNLASFEIDVGGTYDRVDITPYPAYDISSGTLSGITAFLVTQIKACPAIASSCTTSLSTPANTCPYIE